MRSYLDVLSKFEETGVRAWLVGDTVRMLLTGVQPEVITLAVDSDNMYSVAQALGTGTLDSRGAHPALRAEINGTLVRAFGLRGDTIEEDLSHRDLSIEAIAIRSDGGIVDPFGGRFDIRNGVIRLTGDNVDLIDADPLRILRMLRFSAELEMDMFWKTTGDVREFLDLHSDRMKKIPAERWGREIMKGIHRRPYKFIKMCDDFHLIPFFLSELDDLRYISDGKDGNLFEHVLKILKKIEEKFDTDKIMQSDAFVLAGLFSRIGTKTSDGHDRTKFTDRLVNDYLTSWNVSSDIIDEVAAIINSYESFYKPISEKQFCEEVLEFSREAVTVALHFARCVAEAEGFIANTEISETIDNNAWNLMQVLRRFNNVEMQMEGASRYLTGREVMTLLNMKPGKRVGELLDGLDMAVGLGKVNSRARAEAWLKAQ